MSYLELRDISKTYGEGAAEVHAHREGSSPTRSSWRSHCCRPAPMHRTP